MTGGGGSPQGGRVHWGKSTREEGGGGKSPSVIADANDLGCVYLVTWTEAPANHTRRDRQRHLTNTLGDLKGLFTDFTLGSMEPCSVQANGLL